MTNRVWRSGVLTWAAWVIAGAFGVLLPVVPNIFNIPTPLDSLRLVNFYVSEIFGLAVAAIFLGTFQYAVLRLAIGRQSLRAPMWIPTTVGATLAGYIAVLAWSVTVPRMFISVQAIHDSLPAWVPFDAFILVLIDVAVAVFVGVAQGTLLRHLAPHRNAVPVWLGVNVVAAVAVGMAMGFRYSHYTYVDEATADIAFTIDMLITGGLYAAVTGVGLVGLLNRPSDALQVSPASTA